MIGVPFQYDGVGYYGWMAHAYLKDFLGALKHFSTEQAPVFYSLQLLWTKLFGFSYPKLLAAQFLLVFLLMTIILFAHANKKLWAVYLAVGTSLFWSSGIFQFQVGGVFDYRIDIWGSLVLALALFSFKYSNYWTAIIIAVAISERFHNISILLGTGVLLTLFKVLQDHKQAPRKIDTYRPIFLATAGVIILIGCRFNYFTHMWEHYRSHLMIGIDDTYKTFMFSNRSAPGFWIFYCKALVEKFLVRELWILPTVALLLIYWRYRKLSFLNLFTSPLLTGSLVALILLHVNLARNNEGVLRYFLTPFFLWMAVELSRILVDSKIKRSLFKFMVGGTVILGWGLGIRSLVHNLSVLDYKGLQSKEIAEQIGELNQSIYSHYSKKNISRLSIASTFQSDYALSDLKLWTAFLAENRIFNPRVELYEAFGSNLYSKNPAEIVKLITGADMVLLGERSCLEEPIPLNAQIKIYFDEIEKIVRHRCTQLIATLDTNCRSELLDCTP